MAFQIFSWIVVISATLLLTICANPDSLVSTLYEKSFEEDKDCLDFFYEKLSGFLQEIQLQEGDNNKLLHPIGKEVEEKIKQKVIDIMGANCNGISLQVTAFVTTHSDQDGANFYVEQLTFQKILIEPILTLDHVTESDIEDLEALVKEAEEEVEKLEIIYRQQSEEIIDQESKIKQLQEKLTRLTKEKDLEQSLGLEEAAIYEKEAEILAAVTKKYEGQKATNSYIKKRACRCKKCRRNRKPNWDKILAGKPSR